MELSTVVFHIGSQPDFEKLSEKGWIHPKGIREEIIPSMLVKDFGDYQISIVHHFPTRDFSYTEAFIHSRPDRPAMGKGEGKGMSLEVASDLIKELYKEVR